MYRTTVNEWTTTNGGHRGVLIQKPLELDGLKAGDVIATTVTRKDGQSTLCRVRIDSVREHCAVGRCVEKMSELRSKAILCRVCCAKNYVSRLTCHKCNWKLGV